MPETDFQKLRGVIVGLGSIGNRHLNNLLSLGVGGMTVVRRKESQNAQFVPPSNATVVHSIEEAIDLDPDFAVVCNPSHLHASTALQFLNAGIHVLIEKPMGRSIDADVDALISAAKSSDQVCAMAYCMRYHPAYRLAKEQVQSGAIGRPLYGKAWFEGYLPDWHPWEDYKKSYAALPEQGGGVLRTLDHELDFLNWVFGPAIRAKGFAINTGGIGIEADDLAMYSMHHPENVTSQVTVSFCRKPASRGFEFVGDKGVLSFEMARAQVNLTLADEKEPTTILDLQGYDINQMYMDLCSSYLMRILGLATESADVATGVEALNTIELLEEQMLLKADIRQDLYGNP